MRSLHTMDKILLKNKTADDKIRNTKQVLAPYNILYFHDRVLSFDDWPVQLHQNKYDLASAGFYYTHKSNIVKCFSCGLRLGKWLKSDKVWKEHYRWSPYCHYINIVGHR